MARGRSVRIPRHHQNLRVAVKELYVLGPLHACSQASESSNIDAATDVPQSPDQVIILLP